MLRRVHSPLLYCYCFILATFWCFCGYGAFACDPGYTGALCDVRSCSTPTGNCSSAGVCNVATGRCRCGPYYSGLVCEYQANPSFPYNIVAPGGCTGSDPTPTVDGGVGTIQQSGQCSSPPGGFCSTSVCVCGWQRSNTSCQTWRGCHNGGEFSPPTTCDCIDSYRGPQCEIFPLGASCYDGSFAICSNRGICRVPQPGISLVDGQCVHCMYGYTGMRCQTLNACNNGGVLSANGFFCTCKHGFSGQACEYDACWTPGFTARRVNETCPSATCNNPSTGVLCSGHGSCLGNSTFYNCTGGYCTGNPVSNHSAFLCSCIPSYSGFYCDVPNQCADLQGGTCNDHGSCVNTQCVCAPGWAGALCDQRTCNSTTTLQNCTGHGVCNASTICVCDPAHVGVLCETQVDYCGSFPVCSAHGSCLGPSPFACVCTSGWVGLICETAEQCLFEGDVCAGHGTCSGGGSCDCDSGWFGPQCQMPVCEGHSCVCPDSTTSPGEYHANPSMSDALRPFVVLARLGITRGSSGTATASGDVGSSPVPMSSTAVFTHDRGVSHATADASVTAARVSAQLLFNDIMVRDCDEFFTASDDLAGMVLPPGVYCYPSTASMSGGQLRLDAQNNASAVWIFQFGGNMSFDAGASVQVANGGSHCNVWWGSLARINAGVSVTIAGSVFAEQTAALSSGVVITGRVVSILGNVSFAGSATIGSAECDSNLTESNTALSAPCTNQPGCWTIDGSILCNDQGTCTGPLFDSVCSCTPPWFGRACEWSTDCHFQGTQTDHGCECFDGYYGQQCEGYCGDDVEYFFLEDVCACADGEPANGTCTCTEGFYGPDCKTVSCYALGESEFDGDVACSNNGLCVDNECECENGWAGQRCQHRIPMTCYEGVAGFNCTDLTCQNPITGATCSDSGVCVSGVCQCDFPFAGPTCRDALLTCHPLNTEAVDVISSDNTFVYQFTYLINSTVLMCHCLPGYGGVRCFPFPQLLNPCPLFGFARVQGQGEFCACHSHTDGNECDSGDTLASNCNRDNGTCACSIPPPRICLEGKTGPFCNISTCRNPITNVDCSEAGTCLLGVCTCKPGFHGPTCRHVFTECDWRETANATVQGVYVDASILQVGVYGRTALVQLNGSVVCNRLPTNPTIGCGNGVYAGPFCCPSTEGLTTRAAVNPCSHKGTCESEEVCTSTINGPVCVQEGVCTCDPHFNPNTQQFVCCYKGSACQQREFCPLPSPDPLCPDDVPSLRACADGRAGPYCCLIPDGAATACGAHGICTTGGVCVCSGPWGGPDCGTDTRCGGCSAGSQCLTQNHIQRQLATLGIDLEPGNDATAVNFTTAVLNLGITVVPTTAPGGWFRAMGARFLFLGAEFLSINDLSRYWVDCQRSMVVLWPSMYETILYLSHLSLFKEKWRTTDLPTIEANVDFVFSAIYPDAPLPLYRQSVIDMITQPAATDEEIAFALSAILVYQVRQDPLTGDVSFPQLVESQCVCASHQSGPHCEGSCPLGVNGVPCSGYNITQLLGVCDYTTDLCICSTTRTGLACEIDLVGLCVQSPQSGVPLCSSHGTCDTSSTPFCECEPEWSGTFCDISVCSGSSIECSNQGECDAIDGCTCFVEAALATSTNPFVTPPLPIGSICELDGAANCAVFDVSQWLDCGGNGHCESSIAHPDGECVCDNGYNGTHCEISLCPSPGCNRNETCDELAGECECLPVYFTPPGSCVSGDITCRCTAHTCGFGTPSPDGTECICSSHYRVDLSGSCTIIQCPLVVVTDSGPRPCEIGTDPICTTATASFSHINTCCYDACVQSNGATSCSLNATTPVCACDPAPAFVQSGGVCLSRCNGSPFVGGVCECDPDFPLHPVLDTLHEFQSLIDCARVTCLNGGVVSSNGQSCQCTGGFTGPTCATGTGPSSSSSSSTGPRSSSSSSTGRSSSSSSTGIRSSSSSSSTGRSSTASSTSRSSTARSSSSSSSTGSSSSFNSSSSSSSTATNNSFTGLNLSSTATVVQVGEVPGRFTAGQTAGIVFGSLAAAGVVTAGVMWLAAPAATASSGFVGVATVAGLPGARASHGV